MEQLDSEVPLAPPIHTVAVLYNLKKGIAAKAPDAEAEYDKIDTVHAIRDALESGGLSVTLLEADEGLPGLISHERPDIAFNIAEGLSGRGREGQVPSLLSMLGIPFTGSDATTLCIALDKALTKRVLWTHRVRTPHYEVVEPGKTRLTKALSFPVIVKPNCEGSSKGIGAVSIAEDRKALSEILRRNHELYEGEMLVEEYVEGREFTVGILGNFASARVFPPMEIVFRQPTEGAHTVYSYPVKQDYTRYVRYECPANLTEEQTREITDMARRAFNALNCRDFARVDFRMGADGKMYFIEINPLPGLAPGYSDYPMLAQFSGVGYRELVRGVLDAAAKRLGRRVDWREL